MVPVLPATRTPSRIARLPVPSSTTLFIMKIICKATSFEITCSGFLPSRSKRHTTCPFGLRTSSTACGATALPRFGNVA